MTWTWARRKALGLCLLLLAASVSASAQPQWKGMIVREGDVTVVKNPKEPIYKTPVLELTEDLSLGGPDAENEYAFGQIRDVVIDDDGFIYILDSKSFHIKVFDPSGVFVRAFGRKGQGPGEFEVPLMMSLIRTSGELAVHQVTRRMSFFKTDGTFLRHHLFKDLRAGRGLCDSKGRIYIMEARPGDKESRYIVKKLSPDGAVIATLADSPAPSGERFNPFMPVGWFEIDSNDNFIYGYPETYEIRLYGASDAKMFRRVIRDHEPVAVTAEERAEQERAAEGRGIVFDFPKSHPAYRRFFLSDLGHLLVTTYEKAKDGKTVHDVFDPEGRFIGRVPLQTYGVGILKGKYYSVEEDEDGYQYIKRCAVTWKVR